MQGQGLNSTFAELTSNSDESSVLIASEKRSEINYIFSLPKTTPAEVEARPILKNKKQVFSLSEQWESLFHLFISVLFTICYF